MKRYLSVLAAAVAGVPYAYSSAEVYNDLRCGETSVARIPAE